MHNGITTFVTSTIINNYEPSISGFYPTGSSSWDTQISLALREIIQELKGRNKQIKKFCTPYVIEENVVKTSAYTGTATTEEDIVERMMLVISTTGAGTFTLYGSNDGTNFYSVTSLTTALTTATTLNGAFVNPYKYYRVDYAGTTGNYSAYLVETSFYLAHCYKTLELIFQMLNDSPNSIWGEKRDYYGRMYDNEITNMIASYDDDLSGTITEGEENKPITVVRVRR